MESEKSTSQITLFGLILNIVLTIIKWVGGIMGHSFALVADAIESTNDIVASLFVVLGIKYAQKPPDDNHPYGHGKAEALITFFSVGMLMTSATVIAVHGISNLRHPHSPPHPFVLVILGVVIITKEIAYRVFVRANPHSSVLKAEAWHHRSDAITSLAAFIGVGISVALGPEYYGADDWAALVASVVIFYNAYLIFRPALGEMMDEHSYDDLTQKIRETSYSIIGIEAIEKCYVRKAGTHYFVDLHAHVDGSFSVDYSHALAHQLKDAVRMALPEIKDVLIHIEPARRHMNTDTPK